MYGASDKKTKEDTKRFVSGLAVEIGKSREKITEHLVRDIEWPAGAMSRANVLAKEHFKLVHRTMLFQYLIGSMSMEDLRHQLDQSLRGAIIDYRSHHKGTPVTEDSLEFKEFKVDYMMTATDVYHTSSEWYDHIINLAHNYPRLGSILDVFTIDQPLTFSDMNTTDDPVD